MLCERVYGVYCTRRPLKQFWAGSTMSRRNDASKVEDIKLYNRIFPYLMKKRTESLVYYTISVDMTRAVNFIRLRNKQAGEKKYHLFDIIMAAMARTLALKPCLNRFIEKYEYWQRNDISFSFVVKRIHTNKGEERNAVVTFEPDMIFEEVAAIMRQTINSARNADESGEERIIKALFKLPKFIRLLCVHILRSLDRNGRYPKFLRSVDGLHASAFIANLGSISIPNPPYHHLYEWGTTSLFITFGKLHRKKVQSESGLDQVISTIDFGVTVDERIAEGYYFMQSMKLLCCLLENPHMLETRPDLETPTEEVSP